MFRLHSNGVCWKQCYSTRHSLSAPTPAQGDFTVVCFIRHHSSAYTEHRHSAGFTTIILCLVIVWAKQRTVQYEYNATSLLGHCSILQRAKHRAFYFVVPLQTPRRGQASSCGTAQYSSELAMYHIPCCGAVFGHPLRPLQQYSYEELPRMLKRSHSVSYAMSAQQTDNMKSDLNTPRQWPKLKNEEEELAELRR